jgi:hypothetical protein
VAFRPPVPRGLAFSYYEVNSLKYFYKHKKMVVSRNLIITNGCGILFHGSM